MEMDLLRRQAVNFSLRDCDAIEDGDGFLLHPLGESAVFDQLLYLGERAAMSMFVRVRFIVMVVFMAVLVAFVMRDA